MSNFTRESLEPLILAIQNSATETEMANAKEELQDYVYECGSRDDSFSPLILDQMVSTMDSWIQDRPVNLAYLIEATVMTKGPHHLGEFLCRVLKSSTNPLLSMVVVQRMRKVEYESEESRTLAWETFKDYQTRGLTRDEYMVTIPSATHLGREAAIPWLLQVLDRDNISQAQAAASGILDMVCGNTRPPMVLEDQTKEEIAETAIRVIRKWESQEGLMREQDQFGGTHSFVWLLGYVSTPKNFPVIAREFAKALHDRKGLNGAAALRSIRGAMKSLFIADVLQILEAEFNAIGADTDRLMKLVQNTHPPSSIH